MKFTMWNTHHLQGKRVQSKELQQQQRSVRIIVRARELGFFFVLTANQNGAKEERRNKKKLAFGGEKNYESTEK